MDTTTLIGLFQDTTKLKPGQTKVLTKLILQYEETEDLAYEAIGLLNSGIKYAVIKKDFQEGSFGWSGCAYTKQRGEREFRDNFLSKPPEISEGETECPKCGHKKTLVVEMQTRSADEGYTYYIYCFNSKCKAITK